MWGAGGKILPCPVVRHRREAGVDTHAPELDNVRHFEESSIVTSGPATSLAARLRDIQHVALDMDGTLYRGRTLFDWTLPFLGRLERICIGYTFLTNNSSRSARDYVEHLKGMGIRVSAEDIVTSATPTFDYLREEHAGVKRLFVLGTESLAREVVDYGFEVVDDDPEAVVVGFDDMLTHERLSRAAYWIGRGLPFVATHPDRICPTDQPTLLVDCGAVCADWADPNWTLLVPQGVSGAFRVFLAMAATGYSAEHECLWPRSPLHP